jgi:hypothetical protein
MIFMSKNEAGEDAVKLILEGRKTVTRRSHPYPVGSIRAVQPGRGKKGVCMIKIISCLTHEEWFGHGLLKHEYEWEANKEGFKTWEGLEKWFRDRGQTMDGMYRIEFEVVKE